MIQTNGASPLDSASVSDAEDKRPASFLNAVDPATKIEGMPPNFGAYPFPHVMTFQGLISSLSKVYRPNDEALKHSYDNARFMRKDPLIRECLEQRQRSTALLSWHLEPEDAKDAAQKSLCDELTKIIGAIPYFMKYRECMLHSLWYGRYGIAHRYQWKMMGGGKRLVMAGWYPIHGDKLVFRYDDGTRPFEENPIGVRVSSAYFSVGDKVAGRWEVEKFGNRTEPTEQGLAYFIPKQDRALLAIHKHMIEDGEYDAPENAGGINGVGIRDVLYWTWYQCKETLALLMDFIERSALGVELWYYPMNNAPAEASVRKAATERIGEGRNVILVPRPVGDDAMAFGVERVEVNAAGAQVLKEIIVEYFGHQQKRYILGQTLTTEASATGLGSNLADVHLNTYLQIIKYDATNLEESITTDLVTPLKLYNMPEMAHVPVKFRIDTESEDVEGKLAAWKTAFDMGLKYKAKDVYAVVGASAPNSEDEILQNPAYAQQPMPGAQVQGASFPPENPEAKLSQLLLGQPLGGGGANAPARYAKEDGTPSIPGTLQEISDKLDALDAFVRSKEDDSSTEDDSVLLTAIQKPGDGENVSLIDIQDRSYGLAEQFARAFASEPDRYAFNAEDHPRGQPDNAGQFAKKGNVDGQQVSEPKTKEHAAETASATSLSTATLEREPKAKPTASDTVRAKIENLPLIARCSMVLASGLRSAKNIPPESHKRYMAAAAACFKRMGKTELERFEQNVDSATFFPDTVELTYHVANSMKIEIQPGTEVGGAYTAYRAKIDGKPVGDYRGALLLDGDGRTDDPNGNTAEAIYAHEFTHAVDGIKSEFSKDEDWKEAWRDEINLFQGDDGKTHPLTDYATTNESEGFAEFGRLIHTLKSGNQQFDLDEIRERFPKCVKFWESRFGEIEE